MPLSKRNKKISLTQTKKKGREHKDKLFEEIQKCVDKYDRIFTFSVQNMRNNKLKDVRQEWKDSRFFFGKNKVTALALGASETSEYSKNLHKVGKKLVGQMGLLFTNRPEEEVLEWFNDYKEADFARACPQTFQTVYIEAGPMGAFCHSIEPMLRQLGLPTILNNGIVTLTQEYKVCQKGKKLTPEQARILKVFGHKMATFRLTMDWMWSKKGSTFRPCPGVRKEVVFGKAIRIKPKQKDDLDPEGPANTTEIEEEEGMGEENTSEGEGSDEGKEEKGDMETDDDDDDE